MDSKLKIITLDKIYKYEKDSQYRWIKLLDISNDNKYVIILVAFSHLYYKFIFELRDEKILNVCEDDITSKYEIINFESEDLEMTFKDSKTIIVRGQNYYNEYYLQ